MPYIPQTFHKLENEEVRNVIKLAKLVLAFVNSKLT